jgi:hypothetical protein
MLGYQSILATNSREAVIIEEIKQWVNTGVDGANFSMFACVIFNSLAETIPVKGFRDSKSFVIEWQRDEAIRQSAWRLEVAVGPIRLKSR